MPTEPSRRLAILGTFDVENYGDLLFPLIARHRLAAAGIDVVPVSPTSRATRFHDAPPPLSQDDLARDEGRLNGVLIGGGNIVHLRDFDLPGYAPTAYPALWAGATAHAVRRGVRVIWNAPGVLAPREPGPPPGWLRRTVAAADRFAVRDAASAEALARWSGRRPLIMPDTALDVARLWPADAMAPRSREVRARLGIPDGQPVVALNVKARSLGGQEVAAFAQALDAALDAVGAAAILLAIGRCHGDHDVVQAIHRAAPGRTVPFDEARSLQDVAAVIGGADAFLGASLHGHVTAAAYGVPARVVAAPALHKFAGQAEQMNRVEEVVADWGTALAGLRTALAAPRRGLPSEVEAALDAHWAEVARLATGDRPPVRDAIFDGLGLDADLRAATLDGGHHHTKGGGRHMVSRTEIERSRAEVDRAVAGENQGHAAETISATPTPRPDLLPSRLAEVRLALAQDDATRAADLACALAEQHPLNPWAWLLHVQSLARAGRGEAAAARFHDGLARLAPDEGIVVAAVNDILPVIGSAHAQVAFLRTALDSRPDSAALQLRLAMRAYATGAYDLAAGMLERAEAAAPLPGYARQVRSRLQPFVGSMDEATNRVAAEVEGGALDVETLCRLCRFAAAAGRFEQSRTALRRALDLHPREWRSLYRLNRVFLDEAEDAALFDRLVATAASEPPNGSWQLQFALFALRAGQEEAGRATLARLSADEASGPTARMMLDALEALGPAAPRPPVTADAHVRVVRVEAARGTIVLFGGLLGGLSHIHDRYLDALLADIPAHVVYLRDPHGRAYLNGIPDLGADEAAMHAGLADLVAGLGDGRLVTMGGSIAGYAALRAGLALGAGTVISLAGLVTPGSAHADEAAHNRQGLEEVFGHDFGVYDLRPALRSRPETRLVHVVGGDYPPDLGRSRALAGIPNVEAHVLPGVASHHVALPALANQTLRRLLEAAFAT